MEFSGNRFLSFLIVGLFFTLAEEGKSQTYDWSSPQNFSGGESDGVHTRYWAPGISTGYFSVSFSFYTVPDSMVITFGGQPVYSTGGYVSGSQTVSLSFGPSAPGTYPNLQVVMNPQGARSGTAWAYTLTPTAAPILQSLSVDGPSSLGQNSTGTFIATARYTNGSTKIVPATWRSTSRSLQILNSGTHVEALATSVSKPTRATLIATYTEGGVTEQGSRSVYLDEGSTTNNPEEEEKLDPDEQGESKEGGPIHTGTGAESFFRPLISITGVRHFEFGLHYSSTFSGVSSPVGKGWSHPHAPRITESSDVVTIRWSPTRANKYTLVRSNAGSYYVSTDDASRFDILEKTIDNGFILTKPDQSKYFFNSSRNLFETTNSRGQRLVVSSSNGTLNSVTEPVSGASLSFTHSGGRMTQIIDNIGRSVSLAYTSAGLLSAITDLNGNTTTYSYNAGDKLATVTAADGAVIYQNTYDSKGRVISQDDGLATNQLMSYSYRESKSGTVVTTVTDRTGAKKIYVHDSKYRLRSMRDPLGSTTVYTYDRYGNRISSRNPLGRTTHTVFDDRGNTTRVISPNYGEARMVYDDRNNLVRITNAEGNIATIVYDASNSPLESTDFSGATTIRSFNANAQILTETSPRGHTTTFSYSSGRLSSVTNALGQTRSLSYDPVGRLIATTDEAGRTTSTLYSASGKVLEKTNPIGGKVRYSYDVRDRLKTITDEIGGVTSRDYDANSNLVSITNALGGITRHAFDGEDRIISSTDVQGRVTSFNYDRAGRLVSSVNPLNEVTRYKYDRAGNQTGVLFPSGESGKTSYSSLGLPVQLRDALRRTTKIERDILGREIARTDPSGRTFETAYDEMGRRTSETDPLGDVVGRSYDLDGNLAAITNAAGATTSFTYDPAGRQTSLQTSANRTTSFQYDPRGLVSRITEPSGQVENRSYDNAGRLVQRTDSVGTTNYTYDAKHRLLTVSESGKTISRQYDGLNRLTRFEDGEGNVIQYAYDAIGNLTTLTYPDGKQVNYDYDDANRMTQVTDWAGRITSYTYNRSGRLLSTTRANGTRQLRIYDRAGQLTSLRELDSAGGTIAAYRMRYDKAGQLTSEEKSPEAPPVLPEFAAMTYDADDRLTQFNGSAVNHDVDGNMTRGPINGSIGNFTYDARNRLTSAGGLTYAYDSENRRIESRSAGATTRYVNDPNAPLWRVLNFRTDSGPTTYCVHGIGLIYTETNGTALYHHYDLRGRTVATTGDAGGVTFSINYGPYGELLQTTPGLAPTPFLFVGQYGVITDSNALCYSRARFYNPESKRFLNADPIRFAGGVNFYSYVDGQPLLRTDSSGLWFGVDDLVFTVGGAVAGVGGELIANWVTGTENTWSGITGAAVGGATGGATLLYTGNPFLAGAAGGAASNLTTQLIDVATDVNYSFDPASLAVDTTVGTLTGFIPGVKIPGINSGRGSYLQIYKQIATKAKNGTISKIQLQTALKMGAGAFHQFAVAQGVIASEVGSEGYEYLKPLLEDLSSTLGPVEKGSAN